MTQIDVSLTDYGLAIECAWLAFVMGRLRVASSPLPLVFMAFFISIAVAAAAGGTVHGFFLDETTRGYQFLWPFTLIAIGFTALSGVQAATTMQLPDPMARSINRIAVALYVVYCLIVLFIRRDFLVAIVGYLPALILLGGAFLLAYRRQRKPAFLIGFAGICTMLFAAAAQQAKLGINPHYFNYNALYHVLQAVALFMLFLAARESCKPRESGFDKQTGTSHRIRSTLP